MAIDLSMNKLKELVSIAKDLDLVINYFFDMLDANLLPSSSMNETESREIQVLLNIVNNVVSNHFKLETKLANTMLEQTADKQVIHGLCFLSGSGSQPPSPINIIYLQELKTAIIFVYYKGKNEMWRLYLHDTSLEVTHH